MILHDVENFIRKFVTFNDHESIVTTCWLAHADIVQDMPDGICSPRLAILSPKKECGKSTLLEITGNLLPNAIASVNISPAALYRMIERDQPVVQLDEIDQKSLEDKLELIHAGFKKGKAATVYRCNNDDGEVNDFNVFGPLMYAGIDKGQMLDTTSSRSIPIRMVPDPYAKPFRFREYGTEVLELQRKLKEWCDSIKEEAQTYIPKLPKWIVGRLADKWEMLFIVAALADIAATGDPNGTPTTHGTPISERLRAAAKYIEQQETEVLSELTDNETLRRDIHEVLREYKDKYIFTKDIITLISIDNDKWRYFNGVGPEKNITGDQLRRFLRPYGIRPEPNPFHIGKDKARGYSVEALKLAPTLPKTGVSDVLGVSDT